MSPECRSPCRVTAPSQPSAASTGPEAVVCPDGGIDSGMVLLSGPFESERGDELCRDRSTGGADTLLVVAYHVSAVDRLERLTAGDRDLPPALVVVSVGGVDAEATSDLDVADDRLTLHTVSAPTDLSRLGLVTSKALSSRSAGGTALCFHSVTELLRLAGDVERVSRFLHLLGGQVRRTGTRAHFHLDPDAHESRELARLRPLFDEVVAFDGHDHEAA